MTDIDAVLEKLLAENPGPVSIAAGIAVLRAVGDQRDDIELQELVGTFAAESWRSIRFDRENTRRDKPSQARVAEI